MAMMSSTTSTAVSKSLLKVSFSSSITRYFRVITRPWVVLTIVVFFARSYEEQAKTPAKKRIPRPKGQPGRTTREYKNGRVSYGYNLFDVMQEASVPIDAPTYNTFRVSIYLDMRKFLTFFRPLSAIKWIRIDIPRSRIFQWPFAGPSPYR
jgi:hypothetical protein